MSSLISFQLVCSAAQGLDVVFAATVLKTSLRAPNTDTDLAFTTPGKNVAVPNCVSGSDEEQEFGVAEYLTGKICKQQGQEHSLRTRSLPKFEIYRYFKPPFSYPVPGKNLAARNFVGGLDVEQDFEVASKLPSKTKKMQSRKHSQYTDFATYSTNPTVDMVHSNQSMPAGTLLLEHAWQVHAS